MSQSLPCLRQESLKAQSPNSRCVSGATLTSQAFAAVAQSALAQLKLATTAVAGVRRVEHVMGMPIIVDVRDDGVGDEAIDDVFDWLRLVDATFSTYKADSEISRLNRGELALDDAPPDVREVLARCEQLRERDATATSTRARRRGALDPSGLVKGWSVDRAAAILEAAGAAQLLGQRGRRRPCCAAGAPPEPRLARRDPAPAPAATGSPRSSSPTDLAIATSGAYARGDHVVDPHTGRPPDGVLSVTVVGPELATADAYATAAFAMGEAGPAWTARLDGYEAMTILADGRVLSTAGFPRAGSVSRRPGHASAFAGLDRDRSEIASCASCCSSPARSST